MSAVVLGLVAGLGVAMPLGAVGVLLLRTGMTSGWRPASAGALGVATVDLVYAAVAVLAGTALTRALTGYEPIVRVIGAVVLASIAARGLLRLRGQAAATPDPVAARPATVFRRFVALTAINPLTAVYFAVIAAGFAARLDGPGQQIAFVAGVAVASAAWQLMLAAAGSLAALKASARLRTLLGAIGDVVILVLAAALAFA